MFKYIMSKINYILFHKKGEQYTPMQCSQILNNSTVCLAYASLPHHVLILSLLANTVSLENQEAKLLLAFLAFS